MSVRTSFLTALHANDFVTLNDMRMASDTTRIVSTRQSSALPAGSVRLPVSTEPSITLAIPSLFF